VNHRETGVKVSISQTTNCKAITGGSRNISGTEEELGIRSKSLIKPTGVILSTFAELDEVDALLRLRYS
jgi:hypothetical protein